MGFKTNHPQSKDSLDESLMIESRGHFIGKTKSPREGADSATATATNLTMTSCESKVKPEAFSLRTVPVWIKGNGKKVKVNAVLDDASNESFVNEEVTGLLGLTAKWETVQVRVLNDSRETFRSMPLKIEIESIDRHFTKTVNVQTCPKAVTGSYRVVDWNSYQKNWPHFAQCNFPAPSKDGFVDVLIGVDNPDMHASIVDLQGPPREGQLLVLVHLDGHVLVLQPKMLSSTQGPTSQGHCSQELETKKIDCPNAAILIVQ